MPDQANKKSVQFRKALAINEGEWRGPSKAFNIVWNHQWYRNVTLNEKKTTSKAIYFLAEIIFFSRAHSEIIGGKRNIIDAEAAAIIIETRKKMEKMKKRLKATVDLIFFATTQMTLTNAQETQPEHQKKMCWKIRRNRVI